MFAVYSVYWGTFYFISKEDKNLAWVDFATSAYFAFIIVLYIIIGTKLIKAINKFFRYDDNMTRNAPGVSSVIKIIILITISSFLRMIFVSL